MYKSFSDSFTYVWHYVHEALGPSVFHVDRLGLGNLARIRSMTAGSN